MMKLVICEPTGNDRAHDMSELRHSTNSNPTNKHNYEKVAMIMKGVTSEPIIGDDYRLRLRPSLNGDSVSSNPSNKGSDNTEEINERKKDEACYR